MRKITLFLVLLLASALAACTNPVTPAEPEIVYIYSVTSTPTDSEQITLKNNSGITVDLTGWTLGDRNDSTHYRIPSGHILNQGETVRFPRTTLGFQINDDDEAIYLHDSQGNLIDTWYN